MLSSERRLACFVGIVALAGCARHDSQMLQENMTVRSSARPFGETPVAALKDWPKWRGPNGDGVARDDQPPTAWSATEHVRWQSPVPGRGHASPIVCGDRV